MIGNAGDGIVRAASAAGSTAAHAAGAGHREARRSLEQALPGEWAALVVTFAVIAVIGAAILLATCLGHERVVARRRARRAVGRQRHAPTRTAL